MDLDFYYAEQDRRMNLPNESPQHYLKRLVESKLQSQELHIPYTPLFGNVSIKDNVSRCAISPELNEHITRSPKKRKIVDFQEESRTKRIKSLEQMKDNEERKSTSDTPDRPPSTFPQPINPVADDGVALKLRFYRNNNHQEITSSQRATPVHGLDASSDGDAAVEAKIDVQLACAQKTVVGIPSEPARISGSERTIALQLRSEPQPLQDPDNSGACSVPDMSNRVLAVASLQTYGSKRRRESSPLPQISKPLEDHGDMEDDILSFSTELPSKPRRTTPPSRQVTPDHSPIASFSKTGEIPPKHRRVGRILTDPKLTSLNFQPIAHTESTWPPNRGSTAYFSSSPIEDASLLPTDEAKRPKRTAKAKAPSKAMSMLESLQERLARVEREGQKADTFQLDGKHEKRRASKVTTQRQDTSVICISSSPSSRAQSPVQIATSAQKKLKAAAPAPLPRKPAAQKGKGKKEKPPRVTVAEYARTLQAMVAERAAKDAEPGPSTSRTNKTNRYPQFLQGKHIVFVGNEFKEYALESSIKKMDIIVRHGGNIMPEYDPKVTTHVVTMTDDTATLRALKLKRLKDIPNEIPTLGWDWMEHAFKYMRSRSLDEMDKILDDGALLFSKFDRRYTPKLRQHSSTNVGRTSSTKPAQATVQTSVPIQPQITTSPVTSAPISPPTSPGRGPRKATAASLSTDSEPMHSRFAADDPLAEFYEEARIQQKQERNDEGYSSVGDYEREAADEDDDETDDEPEILQPVKLAKRGWTCDRKNPQLAGPCPNQLIVDKLTELMELHKAKQGNEHHWRAHAYGKAIRTLKAYPKQIKSLQEARQIPNIGEKTAMKIEEIRTTGDLRRIKFENTEDVKVTRLFQGIYGVGPTIARKWYDLGCRTLDDVRSGKGGVSLSAPQKIGLEFYDDINDRMPREETKALFDLIKPIALKIDPKLFVQVMGSYRRGKATCGDIDIIITRPTEDGLTHSGVLPRLLRALRRAGIVTEDLAIPDDPHDLECIYRGLCRVPNVEGSRRRRIDFLCIPWSSRGAALLYYTGDDIFNRAMRLKANKMGFSLNQKGLFDKVIRDPRDNRIKLNQGVLVASETEEEIFKILKVPWQEPHERVR